MADWYVFCDDSSHDSGSHFALGGVILSKSRVLPLANSIENWRSAKGLSIDRHEIKWVNTHGGNVERYCEFVERFVKQLQTGRMRYACTVFKRCDMGIFRGTRRAEQRTNIAYDFLLNGFIKKLSPDDNVWVYPDKGMFSCDPEAFVQRLNIGYCFKRGVFASPVRDLKFLESSENHYIQIADLMTGIIAESNKRLCKLNSNRGKAKWELINHSAELVAWSLDTPTPYAWKHFDVWFYNPLARKKAATHKP